MERMRDVLRHGLAASLRAVPLEDRLAAAWPVACGSAIAAHTTLAGLEGNVLRVRVTDSAWLRQLQTMRAGLSHDLSRIAGVPVTDILFMAEQNVADGLAAGEVAAGLRRRTKPAKSSGPSRPAK